MKDMDPGDCSDQLSIEQLHRCPRCHGTGHMIDRETEIVTQCRVCGGSGTVTFDPDDFSEFPY